MDKTYLKKPKRAQKGFGRKDEICSIRIPKTTKTQLDIWKRAYEAKYNIKISYEQMFTWWLDNIGYEETIWDKDIRNMIDIVNILNTKADIISYLNKTGKFWEYCNKATTSVSDDMLIEKSLLYLEFEDMPQLFNLYGKERCEQIFIKNIKSKGKYYSNISFLLESLFF